MTLTQILDSFNISSSLYNQPNCFPLPIEGGGDKLQWAVTLFMDIQGKYDMYLTPYLPALISFNIIVWKYIGQSFIQVYSLKFKHVESFSCTI